MELDPSNRPTWAANPDERHFPTDWYEFLCDRKVDRTAQLALFSLYDKGSDGQKAAADIIWKVIKKEFAQEAPDNYSGFIMKGANRYHKWIWDTSNWA